MPNYMADSLPFRSQAGAASKEDVSMPGTPRPFAPAPQTAPGGAQPATVVITPTPVATEGSPFRVTKG